MKTDPHVEHLLRDLAPQVLGALVRRYGQFEACEDAMQEALLDAAAAWSETGLPENPRGWLAAVANRRLTDLWRSESARRRRELNAAVLEPTLEPDVADLKSEDDDTLTLLFMCCHPALSAPSQVALTLRAVGGLTTAQIAAAFLVPEATMGQRITRAKQRIKTSDVPLGAAAGGGRLDAVLHVLYLIFNEGYTASSGPDLQRPDLTAEAIRLAREVHRLLPGDGEVAGLLALMLLTDARRAARTSADGGLIPLAEQDRRLWSAEAIAEGTDLITQSLATLPVGPYQIQAAIAAVHAEASRVDETDWPQILSLYRVLEQLSPGPMVTLNRAVALAMVEGPRAGLDLLATLDSDDRIAAHHRLDAVRAHLFELADEPERARAHYLRAAQRTTSLPEQRYLRQRAAGLA